MWIQVLHLIILLLFSFLDYHLTLFQSDEHQKYVDLASAASFLKFLSTYVLAYYVKKIILMISPKFNIKPSVFIIFQIDIVLAIAGFFLLPVLDGKAIFFSRYNFIIIIILVAHFIFNNLSEKFGTNELYFAVFVCPTLILWTQSVLFRYSLLRTTFNVGTLTLQYIVLNLLYPQDFKSYGQTNLNAVIIHEIKNPHFKYPLAKLFGRQDSFRLIFIIFNYCCFDLLLDFWKSGNSM